MNPAILVVSVTGRPEVSPPDCLLSEREIQMKKESTPKPLKKLSLHRETLRSLEEGTLELVVGGVTYRTCSERCTGVSCYC